MEIMANQTFVHAISTDQYFSSSDGDNSFFNFDSLQDLSDLVYSLTKDQINELLNTTGYDETILRHLSSKFVFSKSCDEDLNDTPEAGNLSDAESALYSQSFLYGIGDRSATKSNKTEDVPRELQVQRIILLYVPLVIYTIGVVGNCLSFSVLVRRRMRRVSTYTYLSVLSVVDTFVLTVGLLVLWTGEVTGTSIRDRSDFSCKIINALGYTVSDLSVWLIIAVTVERFIAVCYPLRAATTCRRKTAFKVILFLFAIMVLLNLHFLWTTKIKVYDIAQPVKLSFSESGAIVRCPAQAHLQKRRCTSADGYDFLVERFWPWLDAIVYSFLPFVIIIILNSLIIIKVLSARRKRCMMTIQSTASLNRNETGRHGRNSKRAISSTAVPKNFNSYSSLRQENWKLEKQKFSSNNQQPRRDTTNETNVMLSLMLLTISFAFLLMTLPMNIMLIINNLLNTSTSSPSTAANHWARCQLAVTITELLMYLNHSTNFFLYCATGQKFRFELKRMVTGLASPSACCKKRCCAKKWSSLAKDDRHRNSHLDWSLRNNNANHQTMQEKSQANQTIIMNTLTSKNT